MDRTTIKLAIAAALLALVVYPAWLWRAEHQVRLHQSHFLKAIAGRNWNRTSAFIADNYSDRWGHDKTFVLGSCNDVFSQFVFCNIENRTTQCTIADGTGTAHTEMKITGTGGPFAQIAMTKVNSLQGPWIFTWQKQSWKPWDWTLVKADHPGLNLESIDL